MKKKIDVLQEHYLIPAVLGISLISLVFAVYYFNEWQNIYFQGGKYAYYSLTDKAEGLKLARNMGTKALLSLALTISSAIPIKMKYRSLSVAYILFGLALMVLLPYIV